MAGVPVLHEACRGSRIARIVSIADAFDALTSTRPYRQAVAAISAVDALKPELGAQFDPDLLASFIQMIRTESLREIVGHSEKGVSMVDCPSCGTVITVSKQTQDGDIGFCRGCGSTHRLRRDGGQFRCRAHRASGYRRRAQAAAVRPVPSQH